MRKDCTSYFCLFYYSEGVKISPLVLVRPQNVKSSRKKIKDNLLGHFYRERGGRNSD